MFNTIESRFEYQANEILKTALKGEDIENLDDVEKFQDEIWKEKLAIEIGRKFMERLSEWNGEETFKDVMEELLKEQEDKLK